MSPFQVNATFLYPHEKNRKIIGKIKSLRVWKLSIGLQSVKVFKNGNQVVPQPAITCSKLAIKTLKEGVKYVQS